MVVVITQFVEEGPRLQNKGGQYHLRQIHAWTNLSIKRIYMNTIMKKIITKQSCNHHLEKINNHNEKKKYLKSKQKMFQTFIYILKIANST